MLKWLGKVRLWRRGPKGPVVHEYGQYVYKPVIARALSVVLGVEQSVVCSWVQNPEINVFLNDELIQGSQWARRRLESGNYEIRLEGLEDVKIPSHDKVWRFFIG